MIGAPVSWMKKVIWAVRDQLEKDSFTCDLAALWSKYAPKKGANSDGTMRGLGLSPDILKQVYETTPTKLLNLTAAETPSKLPAKK